MLWCCIAAIPNSTIEQDITVSIEKIDPPNLYSPLPGHENGNTDDDGDNKVLDLADSRKWMEHMEEVDFECPCAYDILRCDLHEGPVGGSPFTTIWGQEYHLDRLVASFHELVRQQNIIDVEKELSSKQNICSAVQRSKAIIESLLIEASSSPSLTNNFETYVDEPKGKNCTIVQIVKVAIVWKPLVIPSNEAGRIRKLMRGIIVKGHASCNGIPFEYHRRPDPIIATVALPDPRASQNKSDDMTQHDLPDRHLSPHAKITSWSRRRKPLEHESTFRPTGTGEILLVRQILPATSSEFSNVEILEGLTSNFFAIYRDGTVRTAKNNVLCGYVRHLVLELLDKCGLTLDDRPCLLIDGMENLWKEAFITSSSRLIYPIRQILIPDYDISERGKFKELWRKDSETDNTSASDLSKYEHWEELYDNIIRQQLESIR